MRSLTMSRRTRFLAAGAVVLAVGVGGGGLASAASSASAPAHGSCKGLHLTPVYGVKLPKVIAIQTPVLAHGKPVVCGPGGITTGR